MFSCTALLATVSIWLKVWILCNESVTQLLRCYLSVKVKML